jgi:predicted RNase H-like HicB family nuclease
MLHLYNTLRVMEALDGASQLDAQCPRRRLTDFLGYTGAGMALKITASVRAATRRDDDVGVYVAFCPTLQLYSQGTDEKRARQALESAILLFLSTCIKNGVLDEALKDRGFDGAASYDPKSPKQLSEEFVSIEKYDQTYELDVPLYLLTQSDKELTC